MARIVLPRIRAVIEMRCDRIAADLDQAAILRSEVDAIIASNEEKLTEARERASLIIRTTSNEVKVKEDAKRAEVNSVLESRLVETEKRIASIASRAMQDVGIIVEETVAEIIKGFIGRKIDKRTVAKAVEIARVSGVAYSNE